MERGDEVTEHTVHVAGTIKVPASAASGEADTSALMLGDLLEHDDPLSHLALKYGTDKGRDHWYTPHYHRRFAEMRKDPVTLLEIGIGGYGDPSGGGKSLRMWREYFTQGVIVGLDITPQDPVEGCFVELGDATDNRVLNHLGETYGPFDIVIDDGSHVSEDILRAWVGLWGYVKPGGWYVIEDLGTAYMDQYGGSSRRTGDTTIGFLQGLIDRIHWHHFEIPNYTPNRFDQTVVGLEIAENIAFIRKGDNA